MYVTIFLNLNTFSRHASFPKNLQLNKQNQEFITSKNQQTKHKSNGFHVKAVLENNGHSAKKLRVINRSREYQKSRIAQSKTQKPAFQVRSLIGNDFSENYYGKKDFRNQQQRTLKTRDDLSFDGDRINEVVGFIEYKMSEINSLIRECIRMEFDNDEMADVNMVKQNCVGVSHQILIVNYQEGMRKVKEVLLDLIQTNLLKFHPQYHEEMTYFIELVDQLVESDFRLKDTLPLTKKASRYFVSPEIFDQILIYAEREIEAFSEIQDRLKEDRNEIQESLKAHYARQERKVRLVESSGSPNQNEVKKYEELMKKTMKNGDKKESGFDQMFERHKSDFTRRLSNFKK